MRIRVEFQDPRADRRFMKKYVNLLPKEAQKEIRLERISSRLLNLLIWVLVSLVILVVLMIAARVYLNSELNRIDDRIVLQKEVVSQEENKALKKELTEFNAHLSNLVKLESSHAYWSEVLIELARLLPQDLAVDALTADRETRKMTIIGFAGTRDSVLQFRRNLISSQFFEDVNFPLSNLIRPTDVNFRYTFFVNADALLEKRVSPARIDIDIENLEDEVEE